ncbi:hypothetical protein EV644_12911 [Kribbella orskensis]|uniref:Uncharacterized protein n=1 Tax=Kribbella orskensis TaxID=2512216 RepID=A0ABY2BB88_9ACTN|nr:hypothetical protein EV644_12911 [Kribbella orskensis]
MLFGAVFTLPSDAGIVLGLATVATIVAVAVLFRDLMLLAIGALGALNILPPAISEWFPGELAAPLVLFAFGGLLVAAAIYTAQQRRIKPDTPPRERTTTRSALHVSPCRPR